MPADYRIIKDHQDRQWDEVDRQETIWGVQSHPDGTGDPAIIELADQLKALCDAADADGSVTWAHIFIEEVAEALAETDPGRLLDELDQCNAVALSWQRDIHTR